MEGGRAKIRVAAYVLEIYGQKVSADIEIVSFNNK
jgi:hypothetical protein